MNAENSRPVMNRDSKPSTVLKSDWKTYLLRKIQILYVLVALSFLCFPLLADATTTINHQFTSATINPGDTSQYRITIANTSLVPLTAAAVTEVLLSQVKIASPANISNTCGFTENAATPGTSTVYLTGGTIPAGTGTVDGQCYFQLNVTSTTAGNWVNSIPANTTPNASTSGYSAKENGVDVWNTTPATATLSVNTLSNPTGAKVFAPSPAIVGDPITLTITLNNPNAGATLPLTTFTDTLPTGMVVAPTPSASTTCSGGSVTATAGSGTITLTGGTIGISGSCAVTAKVLVSSIGTNTTQSFTNTLAVGAIGNTRGLTSPTFNRLLTVNTPIGVAKSFGTPNIPAGQPSLATITISNASTANILDITSFSDNLSGTTLKILNTASTPVAALADPAVVCSGTGAVNGTLTAPADLLNQTLSLTGAKAGPGGNCRITAYMTSTVDGGHINSIAANAVVTPNSYASPAASATLTANAQLTVAKAVTVANVAPGQWTQFTVTLNNWSGGTVTGVNFKDVLPSASGNQMTLFDAGSGFYATDAGCSGGAWTGTDATGVSTGNSPTATDAGILWSGGSIVAGSGASAGVCNISLWAKVPASAATGLTFTNTINTGSITGTGPAGGVSNTNTASRNVVTVASGSVTKAFVPASIAQGAQSTLTITINNRTVSPLTGVNLTDTLPVGLTLYSNPAATNTCGGSLQAFPNDNKIVLTDGTVAARPVASELSSCVITVKVTGTVLGVKTNTINPSDFSNNEGVPILAATNTLTINTGLTGTKTFTPTSVTSGGTVRVKVTVTNSSNGGLTNVSVDDNPFPSGLTVANPANAATSCAGSPTMVVNPGATRAQLLGATIPAAGSCDFSFDVVTSGSGPWVNTILPGNITSAQGLSNTSAVTATLTATTAQININKSFNPVLVTGGVPSVLQIDVINPSSIAMTGVGFTDTFPLGIEVYSVPNASTDCAGGTVTAIPGDGKVILSGATVAAGRTCHVYVTTTSFKFLNLTNTIPAGAIVSNQGYTNPTGTSATLSTLQGLNVMKAFSPAYVAPSDVTTLKMRLLSTYDPNAPMPITLTGVSYTDTLPNGVLINSTPNASTDCAGTGPGGLAVVTTSNNGTSNGLVTLSQATILPGTNCWIYADVVASVLGAYNNTIPANTVTSDQGILNSAAANATLFVVNKPTISKAVANATRNPGQPTRLTVTITNGSSVALTGVALTDTLPVGLEIASTPNTGGTCVTTGNGVIGANAGSGTLAISGATIAASTNCTFWADVLSNVAGVYNNSISANTLVNDQGLSNPGAANATLTVYSQPTVSKVFSPVSIAAGGTSTLTITLGNPNTANTTLSAAFVDALPGNVVVANPPNVVKTCTGTVTAVAGSNSITYANGSTIPFAGGGCTISVNVTSSVAGVYTNTIAAGQLSTGFGVNQDPAVASLAVGPGALVPPALTKSFNQSTIFTNATSALTITLGNPNSDALTLASLFTDTLPTNVLVATTPNIRGTCAGTVTAAAGAGTITYASGASIPSGGCTIIVDVTSSASGSYTNTLTTSALVTDGGSPALPATAGLVVNTLTPPTVLKSFNPGTINPGGVSRLTISLGNSNGSAISLINIFTDSLPSGVLVASTPNVGGTCAIGSVTAAAGTGTITYASGAQIPSGGCTIQVDITAASNVGSPFTNAISASALQTTVGNNGAQVTAKLFVNPPQPPSISKSFSPLSILAGATSTLTISLGNGNAAGTTLTNNLVDTLPSNVVIAATPNIRVGGGCTLGKVVASAGSNTVTYQTGGEIPGGGCSIAVDVTSNIANVGYVNTIAAGALQTGIGNNAASTSATLTVVAPDLTITKTHSGNFTQGQTGAQYTITVRNSGSGDKTAGNTVTVAESAPSGLTVTAMSGTGWTCAVLPTCTRTDILTAGSSYPVITVAVDVASNAAASLTNSASVSLSGQPESNTNNNTATDPTTITQLPDLTITKTHSGNFTQGQTGAQYTITVSNNGPGPASGTVTVVDTLPTGLTATAISGTGWSCVQPGGPCTRSDVLASGGGYPSITLTVDVATNAPTSLVNTATVSGGGELNTSNNTANDSTTIDALADLSITKTASNMIPGSGDSVVFTLTVTNHGPSDATGVVVFDHLPSGVTYQSDNSGGSYNPGTGIWQIGNLVSGTPVSITVTVTVNQAGRVVNIATITESDVPDPDLTNNSSGLVLNLGGQADLAISKGVDDSNPSINDAVVFTLTVTNNGPDNVTGVQVSDLLPAGLTYQSDTSGGAYNSGTGIWTVDNLNVGDSATIRITALVSAAGEKINTARITGSSLPDPDKTNNQASVVINPAPAHSVIADLAVQKTVSQSVVSFGGNAVFTIVVRNNGPDDATNVSVEDVLPSGVSYVSSSSTQGTYNNGSGIWAVASLEADTYALLDIVVQANDVNPQTNTATVKSLDQFDPNSSNDSGSAVVSATAVADLTITKADGVTSVTAGGTTTYTIVVSNGGPSTANGAVFTDPAVSNLIVTGVTCGSATGGAACPAVSSTTVALMQGTGIVIPTLPSGGSVTFSVTGTVGASGSIVNVANIAAPTGTTDPTPGNNSATDTDTVNPESDLSITKTDGVSSVTAGGTTTYTIAVGNLGPSAADGAVVKDAAATGLSKTGTPTCGSATGGAVCPGTVTNVLLEGAGVVIPTLPSGGSVIFTITADVTATSGSVANTATVTAPAGTSDSNANNNSATDTDTVNPEADLSITKMDGQVSAVPGQGVTYTISVSNGGPSNVTGATVIDTMPAILTGVTWTCVASGGASCTSSGTGNISDTVNIPVGGTATYTVTGTVSAFATGNLVNTATVSAPVGVTDPTPGNNSTTDTDALIPQADLSVTKMDSPDPVVAGQNITYAVMVTNNGPSSASNVMVADTLPGGVTYVSAAGTGWSCSESGGTVTCTRGALAVGAAPDITIVVTAPPSGGTITNNVVVSSGTTDSNSGNNSASAQTLVTVIAIADLVISKTHSGNFTQGQTGAQYTITVTNSGAGPTSGTVTVTDTLPTGLTATAISGTGWSCTLATLTCTRSDVLAVSASYPVITLTVDVASNAPASMTNTATVSGGGELNTTNDTATDPTTISSGGPNLYDPPNVTKTVDGSGLPVLRYTAVLINSGNGAALGVVFTDSIPQNTTYVPNTITLNGVPVSDTYGDADGGFDQANNRIVVNIGTINAGSQAVLSFSVRVNNGFFGRISNQARVGGSNLADEVTDDPRTPAVKDPTNFDLMPISKVPTLTEWGFIILLTLTGSMSVYYLRRQKNI